jgi:hypothetical protein
VRRWVVSVGICLGSWVMYAQPAMVKVSGQFGKDTVKVGEPVSYYLSARYPDTKQVLFPDSSFSFTPFEIVEKRYVATQTRQHESYDSVIYLLRTFSLDSVQSLTLPVFELLPNDCTAHYSSVDHVRLKFIVQSLPDSLAPRQLPVKITADYIPMKTAINYPLIGLIASVLVIMGSLALLIFGKPLLRQWEAKRLARKHQQFLEQFSKAEEKNQQQPVPKLAEGALGIWKKYVETLSGKPYTRLTTREVVKAEGHETLLKSLMDFDRMIYGGIPITSPEPFQQLKTFAEQAYLQKMESLKNG